LIFPQHANDNRLSEIPFTVHGFIGYTALMVMLIDAILIWRFGEKMVKLMFLEALTSTPDWLSLVVIAYVAGAIIAMTLKN